MAKKSFVMYTDWAPLFQSMDDEQAGMLIKGVFDYQDGQPVHFKDRLIESMFNMLRKRFDIDNEKYQEKCKKLRENGRKGGRPTQMVQDEIKENQLVSIATKCNQIEGDNDNDNDNELIKEKYKREKNQKVKTASERTRFTKPTVEEIDAYCRSRNNQVNAQKFYDFYQSKGWRVGNQAMKDWKACVRTWEQGDKKTAPRGSAFNQFQQNSYDFAKLEEQLLDN